MGNKVQGGVHMTPLYLPHYITVRPYQDYHFGQFFEFKRVPDPKIWGKKFENAMDHGIESVGILLSHI